MSDLATFIASIPFWLLGIIIFVLRIVDVSLGTLRTILMVQGRARIAVPLGFVEVLVWVMAVAQVVGRLNESPWLAPFFAGGHAAGVAVGMLIERRLSLGKFVLRIISHHRGAEIAEAITGLARILAIFTGETPEGPVALLFLSAKGRNVRAVVAAARQVDPDLVYLVESAREWSANMHPLPDPTGWRAVFKKK